MLIDRRESVLVIVDMQERLVPAVDGPERVVGVAKSLAAACAILDVPVVVTEHCPDRIGRTVADLEAARSGATIVTKSHFNVMAAADGPPAFSRLNRSIPIVCGTEAHVCVLQSALGLKAQGYRPMVVADAVASRKPADREIALARLRAEGVPVITAEMALFEWLEHADGDDFRRVLPLIKSLRD
jgi:nicotinamidase-related amidase